MKHFILIYLATITLQDTCLRIFYGSSFNSTFHLGVILKGSLFLFLFAYLFLNVVHVKHGIPKNIYTKSIFLFVLYAISHFVVIELFVFNSQYSYYYLNYIIKIINYMLLSFYVYKNSLFFKQHLFLIIYCNILVVIGNVLFGYFFHIGWTMYDSVEGSFRGFMAGNVTSLFSAISFGCGLYFFEKNKLLSYTTLSISLIVMFIIASKAIFIALIILGIYLLYICNRTKKKIRYITIILIIFFLSICILYQNKKNLNRMFNIYNKTLKYSIVNAEDKYNTPSFLYIFHYIAPNRINLAYAMTNTLLSDDLVFILLGYGPGGIYKKFGRPPMMGLFNALGFYGLFGFFLIYTPQFFILINILKRKRYNFNEAVFISIFLYGALGSFLFSSACTSTIYGLASGILWADDTVKTNHKNFL